MTPRPSVIRNGVLLRPVQLSDAAFIVHERRSPRGRLFLGETKDCIRTQQAWIKSQQEKAGDYYFVCQAIGGQRVGTIGVYEVNQGEAEWGRFLISPAYNAALQALSLLFDFCFGQLQLHRLKCKVVATNVRARRLYEWVGHEESTRLAPPAVISGREVEQIFYTLNLSQWLAARPKVLQAAARVQLLRYRASVAGFDGPPQTEIPGT